MYVFPCVFCNVNQFTQSNVRINDISQNYPSEIVLNKFGLPREILDALKIGENSKLKFLIDYMKCRTKYNSLKEAGADVNDLRLDISAVNT